MWDRYVQYTLHENTHPPKHTFTHKHTHTQEKAPRPRGELNIWDARLGCVFTKKSNKSNMKLILHWWCLWTLVNLKHQQKGHFSFVYLWWNNPLTNFCLNQQTRSEHQNKHLHMYVLHKYILEAEQATNLLDFDSHLTPNKQQNRISTSWASFVTNSLSNPSTSPSTPNLCIRNLKKKLIFWFQLPKASDFSCKHPLHLKAPPISRNQEQNTLDHMYA